MATPIHPTSIIEHNVLDILMARQSPLLVMHGPDDDEDINPFEDDDDDFAEEDDFGNEDAEVEEKEETEEEDDDLDDDEEEEEEPVGDGTEASDSDDDDDDDDDPHLLCSFPLISFQFPRIVCWLIIAVPLVIHENSSIVSSVLLFTQSIMSIVQPTSLAVDV